MLARLRDGAWLGLLPPLDRADRLGDAWPSAGRLPDYLPAPSIIARQTVSMLASGELMRHIGVEPVPGAVRLRDRCLFGRCWGCLAGALRPVERFYEPLISLTYPVPKIALLPLIFAWFGLGDLSKIVIITISVFYPIYISALAGAKSVSRVHVWAARNMGASAPQIICRVLLPRALPQIFNGLRIGLALVVRGDVRRRDGRVVGRARLSHPVRGAESPLRHDVCRHRHHRHHRLRRRFPVAADRQARAGGPVDGDRDAPMTIVRWFGR